MDELENLILNHLSNIDSSQYGQYLTPEEVCNYVQGDRYHAQQVIDWLKSYKIQCHEMCDALHCSGNYIDVNAALSVDIKPFINIKSNQIVLRSKIPYTIPSKLKESIIFIEGISNKLYDYPKPKLNMPSASKVDPGSVTREVFMRMYNIYPTSTGPEVSVGAMEYEGGNGFSNKDLTKSQVYNGVGENPIAKDHILGFNDFPDTESELDTQVMYWGASDSTLWYEDFSSGGEWMYSWAVNFLNRTQVPQVVSISWGWNEVDQCTIVKCTNKTSQQYVNRTNVEFMKIVSTGVTILVASGDAGSPGRTNEMCLSEKEEYGWNHINAVYPGSSPWVLSVGATYVEAGDGHFDYQTPICTNVSGINCAMGVSEGQTTFTLTRWTSGSGTTRWATTPSWQAEYVKSYLNSGVLLPDSKYFNSNGRFYPDVSAFGHNCVVHQNGIGWVNIDGTSCASPVFAGVITNLNAYQLSRGKPTLGFANPLLYKMFGKSPNAFNDVTTGNSTCTEAGCCGDQFGFVATTGWDPVAGMGTPNVEEMKRYLTLNT